MSFLKLTPHVKFVNKTAPPIGRPSCKDCKWSDGQFCNLFTLSGVIFKAEHIRKNIDLCGPDGVYFKPKQIFKSSDN